MNTIEFYKKIDKSIFYRGVTLPIKYAMAFVGTLPLLAGQSRKVNLVWDKKGTFEGLLAHVGRKSAKPVHQIRWDSNNSLLSELKMEFIQSYTAIESANFKARNKGRRDTAHLLGGSQEVLIFRPLDEYTIGLETFIRVETPYDEVFRKLVEENVFGWLSKPNRDYLITKNTKWLDIKELSKHLDAKYIIYYLIDEKKRQIYIGSAQRLGDRVVPNRKEIPGWNKFRYEILHPQYHHLLRRVEFHAINAFAHVLPNNGKVGYYPMSDFRLVNKKWSLSK